MLSLLAKQKKYFFKKSLFFCAMDPLVSYLESWTAKNDEIRQKRKSELVFLLTENRQQLHYLQVFKEHEKTQAYFDVDLKVNCLITEIFLAEIIRIIKCALESIGHRITSLCHSNIVKWTGSYDQKVSFHIVGNKDEFETRPFWKEKAEQLNSFLKSVVSTNEDVHALLTIPWFDLNVYHKLQKFRMVLCTKPAHGIRNCDIQQRVKTPLIGSVYDAIIESVSEDVQIEMQQEPTEQPRPIEQNTSNWTVTGKLKWFEILLNDTRLAELWQKKAESYDDWLLVGMSLAYEVRESSIEIPELKKIAKDHAFNLWVQFSKKSRHYTSSHDNWNSESSLAVKWESECSKAEISRFNVIRQWVSHSKKIGNVSVLDNHYKSDINVKGGSVEFTVHPPTSSRLVDTSSLSNFFAVTSQQFRVVEHIKTATRFWQSQIQSEQDMNKLAVLFQYTCKQECAFWFNYYNRNKFTRLYGELEKKYHPFDFDHALKITLLLIKEIAMIFGVQIDEEKAKYLYQCVYSLKPATNEIIEMWNKYLSSIAFVKEEIQATENLIAEAYQNIAFPSFYEEIDTGKRLLYCYCLTKDENKDLLPFQFAVPYFDIWKEMHDTIKKSGIEIEDENFPILLVQYACYFKLEKEFHFFSMAIDDIAAAKIFYQIYPYLCYTNNKLYIYDCNSGRWAYNIKFDAILSFITKLANFLDIPDIGICMPAEDDEDSKNKLKLTKTNYGQNMKARDNLLKALRSLPDLLEQKKWDFNSMRNSDFRLLLFPNGIYNGNNGNFEPKHTLVIEDKECRFFIKPDVLFLAVIADDLLESITEEDEKEMENMERKLFLNQHGEEVGRFHMEVLACAFLGEVHKRFVGMIGSSSSGKSTEKALIEAVGGSYVGTFSICDFAYNKNERREHALQSAFAHEQYMCRLLLSSENTELPVNTELMKMHSSGKEDKITTRKQYECAQTVEANYLMFFYVNNMWTWNKVDEAVAARGLYFSWNKVYVDEVTNPESQLQNDTSVKTWKYSLKRRQLYMLIILRSYEEFRTRGYQPLPTPDSVLADTNQHNIKIDTAEETAEQLMYQIEFLGDQSEFVKSEELAHVYTTLGWTENPASITKRISTFFATIGVPNLGIKYAKKKERGRTYNGFKGMRLRQSIMGGENDYYLTDVAQWKTLIREHHGSIPVNVQQDLQICARVLWKRMITSEREKQLILKYWPSKINELVSLEPEENHNYFESNKRSRYE